jgi:hypothetical protein
MITATQPGAWNGRIVLHMLTAICLATVSEKTIFDDKTDNTVTNYRRLDRDSDFDHTMETVFLTVTGIWDRRIAEQ